MTEVPAEGTAKHGHRFQPDDGPLAGVLVLDFGQAANAPVAASYMAMLGATVMKIESPQGDSLRYGKPTMRGMSATFLGNNIGKFGVMIDLKDPTDRDRAMKLAGLADVIIDNFRGPEVMTRLGLDYFDVLRKRNPGLVYLQASAFGRAGPWKGMVSFEWIAQAASGFAGATGEEGGPPEFSRGTAHQDWNGAMVNTIAMLAGLLYRARTGSGMMLTTSQFASSVFSSVTRLVDRTPGSPRHGSSGSGIAPDKVFRTADGFVAVCAPTDATWRRLCEVVDRPDVCGDPRLATIAGRFAHRAVVEEALQDAFSRKPTDHWTEAFRFARIPCCAHEWATTVASRLLVDDQVQANGMVEGVESWYGRVLSAAPHWHFDHSCAALRRPSPKLGEHTDVVRSLIDRCDVSSDEPPVSTPAPNDSSGNHGDEPETGDLVAVPISEQSVLSGTRIVEVGTGVSLSMAGLVLRALGASVTKLEPPCGDWLRQWGGHEDESPLWQTLNRSKDTRQCDLMSPDGYAALQDEVRSSDVAIVCGPPRTREKLRISSEDLWKINPKLVVCGISGWGVSGPLSDQPATEIDIQTAAGMTLLLGVKGSDPVRHGFDIVSINTGFAAVQAILAELLRRNRARDVTGENIEISMLQVAVALSQYNLANESGPDTLTGRTLEAYDWAPDHGYKCKDSRFLLGFLGDEEAWTNWLIRLGRVDLLADERFSTIEALRRNERFLPELLAPQMKELSYAELEQLVRYDLGGVIVPLLEPRSILEHPQTKALPFVEMTDVSTAINVSVPIWLYSGESVS